MMFDHFEREALRIADSLSEALRDSDAVADTAKAYSGSTGALTTLVTSMLIAGRRLEQERNEALAAAEHAQQQLDKSRDEVDALTEELGRVQWEQVA